MRKRKKKTRKTQCRSWPGRVLIALLVVLIGFIIFLCVKTYDPKDVPKSLDNISKAATCIMASLSIIFTVYSIYKNNKDRRDDKRSEIIGRWYKELVIDNHLSEIKKAFAEFDNFAYDLAELKQERGTLTGDAYDQLIMDTVVAPFTSAFTTLHKELVADINVINGSLASQVSNNFQSFQDGFLKHVEEREINLDEFRSYIKAEYDKIILALIEYDLER